VYLGLLVVMISSSGIPSDIEGIESELSAMVRKLLNRSLRAPAWTRRSLNECRTAFLVASSLGGLPWPALRSLAGFLRVPCSGSAQLLHPTCSEGHPIVAILRLGHRLGLEPAVSLDHLHERSVVRLMPVLRDLADRLRATVSTIDRLLYQPVDFDRLWEVVNVNDHQQRQKVRIESVRTPCGHHLCDVSSFSLQLKASESVNEQLSAMVSTRTWVPWSRLRCPYCNSNACVPQVSCIILTAPRILHLKYSIWDDGERGSAPEMLVWAGASYRLAAAVFWRKRGEADSPGFYGTLIRIASTQIFRLQDMQLNLTVTWEETTCEEGMELIRKSLLLHLFYERLE